ncbi:MAG TPA: sugar transferase [Saprospiraceae bacterium]|nr:sugar transferase [Saprospiraceae bacterium]
MYDFLKRIIDIIIALIALIVLSPLFLVIMIVLSVTGEREVFYQQNRIGLHNSNFGIYKFVTMVKNSLNIGTGAITLRNDPRVTSVGKYLRMTKLNELPQILNVLNGTMSIVGPRPLVQSTFDAYPEEVQKEIYKSKPGITGVGSIIFRDEEKLISECNMNTAVFYQQVIAPYKGEVELWYNRNKSILTDIKLIFITAWVILFPKSNIIYRWFPSLPKKQLSA